MCTVVRFWELYKGIQLTALRESSPHLCAECMKVFSAATGSCTGTFGVGLSCIPKSLTLAFSSPEPVFSLYFVAEFGNIVFLDYTFQHLLTLFSKLGFLVS